MESAKAVNLNTDLQVYCVKYPRQVHRPFLHQLHGQILMTLPANGSEM